MLEKNIGKKLGIKTCQSNFHQFNSRVNICLYSSHVIIFDEENTEQKIKHIEDGRLMSLVIKLSQVTCEDKIYIPIWKVIQGKLHCDAEKICMFEQPKTIKSSLSPPPIPYNQKPNQQEISEKRKTPQNQSFVPSVSDIVSIKNSLKKVIPEKVNVMPDIETKIKEDIKDSIVSTKSKIETHKKLKK